MLTMNILKFTKLVNLFANTMKTIIPLILIPLVAGCMQLTTPSGWKYSRFGSVKASDLQITVSSNSASVRIKGYQSDAEGLIEAAARGAASGVKP